MLRLWTLKEKRPNANGPTGAIAVLSELNQSLLSPSLFSIAFEGLKKGERFCFGRLFYGRFLVTRIASTAPMMIMTTTIATIPYMTVVFEAKPVSGVAAGAEVAPGRPA